MDQSPRGRIEIGALVDKGCCAMRVADGPYECAWSYRCGGAVISVSATPNCSLVAAASVDCKLYLLDGGGMCLWEQLLDDEGWAVDMSADGGYIAVGTACKKPADGTVLVYDRKGQEIWRYRIHSPVWGVSLSRRGDVLAVTSWNNVAYRFDRTNGGYQLKYQKAIGHAGLYGVSLSESGTHCLISSYEDGLLLLDNSWTVTGKIPTSDGLYGARLSWDASVAVAGCRSGRFLMISDLSTPVSKLSRQLCSRPICGVSMSRDGNLLALGSFDQSAHVVSAKGRVLWTFPTDGEVWSTAMSADGSAIVLGSGDQNVYFVRNRCGSAALAEIEEAEARVENMPDHQLEARLDDTVFLYLRYGLIRYGSVRLRKLAGSRKTLAMEKLAELLRADVQAHPTHYDSHYLLANTLSEAGEWIPAVHHFQEAAKDAVLHLSALNAGGRCFSELGLESAALSCFRRATVQDLDRRSKAVIYNLARSYEDSGAWQEAAAHYELLLAWDASYRNAWERRQGLSKASASTTSTMRQDRGIDYTGLTVSLLGPEIPRVNEVADSLLPILEARARELFVGLGDRQKLYEAIDVFAASIEQYPGYYGLDYDTVAYAKWDYLLPEDQIKKAIEMIHLLAILGDKPWIKRALDIGTATGRYPITLARMGIESIGIDRETDAVMYVRGKKVIPKGAYFAVGDASRLPLVPASVDLITCMMGTACHFAAEHRERIFLEFLATLRPRGLLVVSTWDVQCEHLSFLSMYSQSQREAMRRNSLTQTEFCAFLSQLKLEVLDVKPFILLPDVLSYELGFYRTSLDDIRKVVEIDLAARGIFPNAHGQMYMVTAQKEDAY